MMNNEMVMVNNEMNSEIKNYDMQQLMNITGQIGMNVKSMSNQLGIVTSAVNGLTDEVGQITGRINQLELNEEVTTTQQESITEAAKKRVCKILGSDEFEQKKYFRIFVQKLYGDTRKNAGLGSKIARTRKGDFQRCIDYIEAWILSCRCAELRAKADRNAKARRKAKELGYDI
ncbi:MAG: ORF6C domain-containing protein [Coprococcus sp.]